MFTVESSMCMSIILIMLMQFIIFSFNLERKISGYIDKTSDKYKCIYMIDNEKYKKEYVPAELKKCITIIENNGGVERDE